MRLKIFLIAASSALLLNGVAQAQPPVGATATCKDGSYSYAASKRGACSGHKGVGQWLGSNDATATKTPTKISPGANYSPAASPAASPAQQGRIGAASNPGGTGQVWVNTKSKVYHCPADRYYGKTKAGSYMSEAAAVAAGDRPDHGKACH